MTAEGEALEAARLKASQVHGGCGAPSRLERCHRVRACRRPLPAPLLLLQPPLLLPLVQGVEPVTQLAR